MFLYIKKYETIRVYDKKGLESLYFTEVNTTE